MLLSDFHIILSYINSLDLTRLVLLQHGVNCLYIVFSLQLINGTEQAYLC